MKNLIALVMFYSSLGFAGETSFLVQEDAATMYKAILLAGHSELIEVGENIDFENVVDDIRESWNGSIVVIRGLVVTTVEDQNFKCSKFTNLYYGRTDYMKRVNLYNWTINKDYDRPKIVFDGPTWNGGSRALTEYDFVCYAKNK